jgi:serine/threonine protein kinase
MEKDSKNDLEQSFQQRNETLRGFYDTEQQALSESEQASLTPILNSLEGRVERYREIRQIAEGGEKKISLVHDNLLDRRVAMARAARAKTGQDQEQFLREARLTANLTHPNIMPVYNMGLDSEGVPFFSMELIAGDSLKVILRKLREGDASYREAYPLETLLEIFIKVCDAVAYAHSRNVLHLDIKPDNIRVGPFGEVLVCDWGLARVVNTSEEAVDYDTPVLDADVLNDMTLSGTMKGTPGFMAPEQTVAYGNKTVQTDIYALGALLYMMLTHELPVRGKSANEVIQNTRAGKVVPPRRRKPDLRIPNGLVAVTMKALSLEPEARYASVTELRQEVGRYLSGYPTQAEHAGFVTILSLLVRRHSRIAFLLMFFLLLLASVIGANLVVISREKAEAVAAREAAEANFNLYLEQQQVSQALDEELGEAVQYTVRSRDFVNAPAMIHLLEVGLKEDMDPVHKQNLLVQKGTLHFVMQEFNAALACFKEAGDVERVEQLKAWSLKCARLKPSDAQCLSDRQVADLFHEARWPDLLTMFYLYHHHMRRRPASATPDEYLPLAGAVLDRLNGVRRTRTKPLEMTQTDRGRHLDLSKTPYVNYSLNILGVYRRNVLAPLELDSLDISRSKITKVSELRGMKLRELRMVATAIPPRKNLPRQLRSLELERLVIDVDAYPPETIEELRKQMTVVDGE